MPFNNDPHEKEKKNVQHQSFHFGIPITRQILMDCLLGARHYTVITL